MLPLTCKLLLQTRQILKALHTCMGRQELCVTIKKQSMEFLVSQLLRAVTVEAWNSSNAQGPSLGFPEQES